MVLQVGYISPPHPPRFALLLEIYKSMIYEYHIFQKYVQTNGYTLFQMQIYDLQYLRRFIHI